MKEIVNRLHENRQIELAKSILESNGYRVTNEAEEVDASDSPNNEAATNSGCVAHSSESENDPIMLKLGEDYPITLYKKIESREEAQKVYDSLVKSLNSSVADAVDYCMRRGFSISYNSEHIW